MSNDAASGQAPTDAAPTQAAEATPPVDTTTTSASADSAAAGTPAATETPPAQAPAADPPKPAGAPEKYEFKFADEVKPSEAAVKSFADTARELNLTQDAAQAVLDKVLPAMRADAKASLEAFYKDIGGMPDTWADQVRADKDIGGTKLEETLAVAAKARDAFGGPELTALLNKTGLGNHPALIKAFAKAGQAISADRFVDGRGATSDTRTAAEKLYGKP